jgi:methionine-rich copper-binding protein CopC
MGLLVTASGSASAHAELESSEPPNGGLLEKSPERLTVRFSMELDTAASRMELYDAAGRPVDSAIGGVDLDDPDHASMVITVGDRLPAGSYLVKWTATSAADGHVGHPAEGEFRFDVR